MNYKEIKKKHETTVNALMEQHKVFWAFSNEQLEEGKEMLKLAIYEHLQKVREAVENELTNSDIQGVMEAEAENIFELFQLSRIEEKKKIEIELGEFLDEPDLSRVKNLI